eukprot:68452-Pelagomonas_calceolata.AAC.1
MDVPLFCSWERRDGSLVRSRIQSWDLGKSFFLHGCDKDSRKGRGKCTLSKRPLELRKGYIPAPAWPPKQNSSWRTGYTLNILPRQKAGRQAGKTHEGKAEQVCSKCGLETAQGREQNYTKRSSARGPKKRKDGGLIPRVAIISLKERKGK